MLLETSTSIDLKEEMILQWNFSSTSMMLGAFVVDMIAAMPPDVPCRLFPRIAEP